MISFFIIEMSSTKEEKSTDDTSKKAGEEPPKKRFNNGWTKELENLIADWSDRAQCYRWMHDKTSRAYASYNQYMMIPVIILSTLTGTANFGMDSFFNDPNTKKLATLGVGGVSILTGIISTLANFLRYAQGSEAHAGAAISWAKFSRLISIELALHPNERMEAFAFLKMFRIELDRLIEQSPPIPEEIVRKFKVEFRSYTDIKRPDITGYIEHTTAFNNNSERMKQLATEAALTLKHKKNLLKEIVMSDLDNRIREITSEVVKEAQQPTSNGRAGRIASVLGGTGANTPALFSSPTLNQQILERKLELAQQIPSNLVNDLKKRFAEKAATKTEANTGDVVLQIRSEDNVIYDMEERSVETSEESSTKK